MSYVFLILAGLMLVAAIAFVVLPFGKRPQVLTRPVTLLAAFVPFSAIGLYALLGAPQAMTAESTQASPTPHKAASPHEVQSQRSYGSVASLVGGLRDRLESDPNDAGGWLLLAKSYQHLGRDAEAKQAYDRAKALGKSDLEFEASLLGPLLASSRQSAPSGPVLRGRVSLSAAATASALPDDTVFVFAKESPQHRMPVVALRKRVADLPFDFVLSDREMMVPDASLRDFTSLVVTAKVSRSGNASDNSQGLEAWSEPVSPQRNEHLDLIIEVASSTGGAGNE